MASEESQSSKNSNVNQLFLEIPMKEECAKQFPIIEVADGVFILSNFKAYYKLFESQDMWLPENYKLSGDMYSDYIKSRLMMNTEQDEVENTERFSNDMDQHLSRNIYRNIEESPEHVKDSELGVGNTELQNEPPNYSQMRKISSDPYACTSNKDGMSNVGNVANERLASITTGYEYNLIKQTINSDTTLIQQKIQNTGNNNQNQTNLSTTNEQGLIKAPIHSSNENHGENSLKTNINVDRFQFSNSPMMDIPQEILDDKADKSSKSKIIKTRRSDNKSSSETNNEKSQIEEEIVGNDNQQPKKIIGPKINMSTKIYRSIDEKGPDTLILNYLSKTESKSNLKITIDLNYPGNITPSTFEIANPIKSQKYMSKTPQREPKNSKYDFQNNLCGSCTPTIKSKKVIKDTKTVLPPFIKTENSPTGYKIIEYPPLDHETDSKLLPCNSSTPKFLNYKLPLELPTKQQKNGVRPTTDILFDDVLFTGDRSGRIIVWSIKESRYLATWKHIHENSITKLDISYDNQYLFSLDSNGELLQWKIDGQSIIKNYTQENNYCRITSFCLTPDGNSLYTVDEDFSLQEWSVHSCYVEVDFGVIDFARVNCMVADPNGMFIFTGSAAGNVKQFSHINHALYYDYGMKHHGAIDQIVLSPDGLFLFTCAEDQRVKMWSVRLTLLLKDFGKVGDVFRITSFCITLDCSYAFIGTTGGTMVQQDLKKKEQHKDYGRVHHYTLNSIILSKCGEYFFTAGGDEQMKKWDIKNEFEVNQFGDHEGDWIISVAIAK